MLARWTEENDIEVVREPGDPLAFKSGYSPVFACDRALLRAVAKFLQAEYGCKYVLSTIDRDFKLRLACHMTDNRPLLRLPADQYDKGGEGDILVTDRDGWCTTTDDRWSQKGAVVFGVVRNKEG